MKQFTYSRAATFEEASKKMQSGAALLAGGTDLLGSLKADILPDYPQEVVSIKQVPDADRIEVSDGVLRIGAMAKLSHIAASELVQKHVPALAEAAHSVATPLVRNLGTIGGNLCQDVRCWFYRYPQEAAGRLNCARKGGEQCYGILGDNRYHSIFGGMKTGLTPCSAECPAGTDIPAYMQKIREGNWDAAARIILQANPLPMLTSRVCPHTCQEKCNQCQHGDSVSIHSVERALGDYILANSERYYTAPKTETGKKTAIVGGGPAGLACAFFLRSAGHSVTIYERMEEAGGVLMYGIPEYRLPKHYVRDVVKAIAGMGVRFILNTEVGKDISIEEIEQANDSVFLDTGAWKQPILGIDGESLTQFGLNFLVEVKKFMSKQIGKDVLVCGGGNVAMDVALTARRLGAEHVTLVCLEQRQEMPASTEEIARAEEEGVKIINGRGLKEVIYDGSRVVGMSTNRCVAVRDESGRFNPQYDNDDVQLIEASSIILATGQRVDLDFLGDKFRDEIKSARGLIAVGEHNDTRKPGVYAGGDAATGPSVAIKAIRAGVNAAKNMSAYLGYPMAAPEKQSTLLHCDPQLIHNTKGAVEADTPVAQRSLSVEDSTSLTQEQAAAEAGRCMNCGCYSVNASDLSPVLVALGATLVTTNKTISAADFFTTKLKAYDMLDAGELITAIEIPIPEHTVSHYDKFRLRDSVDFAMVSLASAYRVENGVIAEAHIVLGGVAPTPLRREAAEQALIGKAPSAEAAELAAELALQDAVPFEKNAYKVKIAKTFVADSILRLI